MNILTAQFPAGIVALREARASTDAAAAMVARRSAPAPAAGTYRYERSLRDSSKGAEAEAENAHRGPCRNRGARKTEKRACSTWTLRELSSPGGVMEEASLKKSRQAARRRRLTLVLTHW